VPARARSSSELQGAACCFRLGAVESDSFIKENDLEQQLSRLVRKKVEDEWIRCSWPPDSSANTVSRWNERKEPLESPGTKGR
jgi:hypothetical protein